MLLLLHKPVVDVTKRVSESNTAVVAEGVNYEER